MAESKSEIETSARRASRALAQAGMEFGMFVMFALSILVAVVMFDRWVTPVHLLTFEGQMQAEYAVSDPQRAARIRNHYKQVLSEGAQIQVTEPLLDFAENRSQRIVVNVTLTNLNGPLQWPRLSAHLWSGEEDFRSGRDRVMGVTGPPPLIGMLLLHFLLIPWLFLRYRFLPADSPPARPLFSNEMRHPRFILRCVTGGIVLGLILSLFFVLGMHSGLLTFSNQMPSHESLGMTTLPLIIIGAFALGLGGFLEEAFMRGVVLRRFFQNAVPVFGIVICAFWFAALHAFPLTLQSGDVAFIISIFGAGLGFGWLALKFRSWIPSGFVHAGYNFSVTFAYLAAP